MSSWIRELLVMAGLGLLAKAVGVGVMFSGVAAYVFGLLAYRSIADALHRRATRPRRPGQPRSPEEARPIDVSVDFSMPGGKTEGRGP